MTSSEKECLLRLEEKLDQVQKSVEKNAKEISDLKAANEVILSPIRDSIIKKKKTEAYQKGLNKIGRATWRERE